MRGSRGIGVASRGRRRGAVAFVGVLVAACGAVACAPAAYDGPRAAPVPQDLFAPALGVDLAAMERTESGLYIQTLREGEGAAARSGQRVLVHYEGWFTDGRKFDSSRDRGRPLEVPLGEGIAIRGWDQGIEGMRVGELRRLVVPPELAYGELGVPGTIPSNATLVFEIELLGRR